MISKECVYGEQRMLLAVGVHSSSSHCDIVPLRSATVEQSTNTRGASDIIFELQYSRGTC